MKEGERVALVYPGGSLSYRELDRRISAFSHCLKERGFRRGEKAGMFLPHSPELILLIWACFRAGIIACPVNPKLPAEQATSLLEKIGVRRVFVSPERRAEFAEDFLPIDLDIISDTKGPLTQPSLAPLPLDQGVTVIFTSGTNLEPKGALLTWGNYYYSALGSHAFIPLGPGDRWEMSLPLFHIGGISILFRSFLVGATISIGSPGEATHISWVHTHLSRFIKHPLPHRYKAVLLGGGAVAGSLLIEGLTLGLPLYLSYGMTEMSSQIYTERLELHRGKIKREGRLLPHRELKLAADGEIQVRGKTLFKGYVKKNRVALPLTREGWFSTRDIGKMKEGRLSLLGRKDHLFISRGENVHPEVVEKELLRMEGIKKAIVLGKPHREHGQVPVAFIDRRPGLRDEELRQKLRSRLPGFAIPELFLSWPRGESWGAKVNRRRFGEILKEKYEQPEDSPF